VVEAGDSRVEPADRGTYVFNQSYRPTASREVENGCPAGRGLLTEGLLQAQHCAVPLGAGGDIGDC
jgi:hypothetical protein